LTEVIFMGWSRKRLDQNGMERYTAYYRDARGKTCVAGTFAKKKDANQAWKMAEVRLAEGRLGIRGGEADLPAVPRGGVAAEPRDGGDHT
jgi:hypothetical protein